MQFPLRVADKQNSDVKSQWKNKSS